jgi:hypothetical protein
MPERESPNKQCQQLRGDKIVEHYAVRQELSIARQFGLNPPAPSTTQTR